MSWISVNIDLDDLWDGMDRNDKKNMAEWLYKDGIFGSHPNSDIRSLIRSKEESFGEKELRDDLSKIGDSYLQISNEDCEIIKSIANKL